MHGGRRCAWALAAVCLGLWIASPGRAATDVSGSLTGTLRWTLAGSPYRLVGDTTLAPSASLVIEAGVLVEAQGDWRLTIAGDLRVQGTAEQRVQFTNRAQDPAGGWRGLRFTPTATGSVNHADFRRAATNVEVDAATVQFTGCGFLGATQDGLFVHQEAQVTATHCTFASNGRHGLHVLTSEPQGQIAQGLFHHNGSYPALVSANCVEMLGPGLAFFNNGHQQIGVNCAAAVDVIRSQTWRRQPIPLDLRAGASHDLVIGEGVTLTLQPPLNLHCGRVTVRGRLVSGDGTAATVAFLGPEDTPGSWEGLRLEPGSSAQLYLTRLKYAHTGISAHNAELTLEQSRVNLSAHDGISVTGTSQVNLNAARLVSNGRYGLYLPDPVGGWIDNCRLVGNGSYPVFALARNVALLGPGNEYVRNVRQAIGVAADRDPDLPESAVWHNQRVPFDTTARPGGTVLHIGPAAVLRLEPGVTLWSGGVVVRGRLEALGTVGRPVEFQPPGGNLGNSWEGITFFPGATGRLRHGLIEGAQRGVHAQDASPRLEYLVLRHNREAAVYGTGSASPLLAHCQIRDNPGDGVSSRDTARPRLGDASGSDPLDVGQNALWNNGGYDVRHQSSAAVKAQNNWWGTTNTAAIAGRILDGADVPGSGLVSFTPLLNPQDASAPAVAWTGEPGLDAGAVRPAAGPPTTMFEFRITYTHPQGQAPLFVRLHLYDGDYPAWGSPFLMQPAPGGDYLTGKRYFTGRKLPAGREYRYRVEAGDGLHLATGLPTALHEGPLVNTAPTLAWTGQGGFVDRGVNPISGPAGSVFTFRVRYTDADGDAPEQIRVHLRYNGTPVVGSPYTLSRKSGEHLTGAVYEFWRTLPATQYEYRFEASDGVAAATGPPTGWQSGPTVSGAASVLLGSVTVLQAAGGNVEIRCRVQAPAYLTVRVRNIAGREVARVVEDLPVEPEQALVLWNRRSALGTVAPPGLYLLEVSARTPEGQAARRMAPLPLR